MKKNVFLSRKCTLFNSDIKFFLSFKLNSRQPAFSITFIFKYINKNVGRYTMFIDPYIYLNEATKNHFESGITY